MRAANFLPDDGAYGSLLPWMIAVMVFLSGIAISGALSLSDATQGWRQNISHNLTVQIVAPNRATREAEAGAVLEVLRDTRGVARAERLDDAAAAALLEPWIGNVDINSDLPIPAMVDVYVSPDAVLDLAALGRRLKVVAPSSQLDSHEEWLGDLLSLSNLLQWISAAVLVLVSMTTIAIVAFATHSSLAAHRDIIEVVHLIGARDAQIAGAYQWRFLMIGLKGGLLGAGFVAMAFGAIYMASLNLDSDVLPRLMPSRNAVIAVAALPAVSAIITMVTSWFAVLRSLIRLV